MPQPLSPGLIACVGGNTLDLSLGQIGLGSTLRTEYPIQYVPPGEEGLEVKEKRIAGHMCRS